MIDDDIEIITSKDVGAAEYADLMEAVGWGDADGYSSESIGRSVAAYPFVAVARDAAGILKGYVSAFSDGAFSTFLGELVVHPSSQGMGIGRRLLTAVESYSDGIPVYVKPFLDTESFFSRHGYRQGARQMSVMFKVPV